MLRERRKALGLTQKQVAKSLHISNSLLSLIESKHCIDFRLSLALRICKIYDLDIYELIHWLYDK